MYNAEIRDYMKSRSIPFYEVCAKMQITQSHLSHLMQLPLSENNEKRIRDAIKLIEDERKA